MTRSLLITGTDTGVGKTVLTAALAAYWQHYKPNQRCAIFKPIQSGVGDREYYQTTFDLAQSATEITPLQYEKPLAPPIAAEQAGTHVDLGKAWQTYHSLQQQFDQILVEGVGGLGTPITPELTVADLARDWRVPTVLVVPVKLGSLGQSIANVALARHQGVQLVGIVLSCHSPEAHRQQADLTPIAMLETLTQVPVLGCINPVSDLSNVLELAQQAANLDLELLK